MNIRNIDKIYIYERDNRRCFYCNKYLKFKQITLDHYLPKSYGGTQDVYNLVVCCKKCNKLKGSFVPKDYEDTIINLFKRAVSDRKIRGKGIDVDIRELMKVDRIELITDCFVFQSPTMRFYVRENKVEKMVYLG